MTTIKELESRVGGLSKPSKMPCHGYSIPARHCHVGKKMAKVKDSICSVCYALKGRYAFPNVQNALDKRFDAISKPKWVKNMIELISRKEKSGYFRWHDSGDIQSVEHLEDIVEIAKALPQIQFWLPTREYNIVREFQTKHWPRSYGGALAVRKAFPHNLTVRLSGLMLDGEPPNATQNPHDLPTSGAIEKGYDCPAPDQGNKCLDCRLCWSLKSHINYRKH